MLYSSILSLPILFSFPAVRCLYFLSFSIPFYSIFYSILFSYLFYSLFLCFYHLSVMSEPARERVGSDRPAIRPGPCARRRPVHTLRQRRSRRSARSPAWRCGERSEPASRVRAWALCVAGRSPRSKRGGFAHEPDQYPYSRALSQERHQRAAGEPAA